ncbi:MAG: addiction module protein, partial [Alphaproteobacteria bacterium]
MSSTGGFDFSHLSLDQKIALIAQLWDDVAHQAAQQPLTKAQAEELDRRL